MENYGRAPWFEVSELNMEQRAYYDSLVSGPRSRDMFMDERGRLVGPFNARLLGPQIGDAIQRTGAAIRFGDVLAPREREIAILETARAFRSSYEWNSHAKAGRRCGLTEDELSALLSGDDIGSFSASESLVRSLSRVVATSRDIGDELFAEAEARLGLDKVFVIVSIVGHYSHTALSLRVWRVPLRAGDVDVFAEAHTGDEATN